MSPSNRPASTTDTAEAEATTPLLDLSFTKVIGGALAAVTTALAASFLGVTGTLTGAAFGSVVSSLAAAVYAASFRTAGTRIRATRTIVSRRSPGPDGDGDGEPEDPTDPTTVPPELTGRSTPLPGRTEVIPAGGEPPGDPDDQNHGSDRGDGDRGAGDRGDPAGGGAPGPHVPPRRVPWKPVAALAGLVFAIALGFISLTETFLGHPVSDNNASGTTIERVVGGGAPAPRHTGPSRSTTSGASSDTATDTSSGTATESSSGGPTGTDTSSVAPGGTTAPSGGDTASATDSGTSQPVPPTATTPGGAGGGTAGSGGAAGGGGGGGGGGAAAPGAAAPGPTTSPVAP